MKKYESLMIKLHFYLKLIIDSKTIYVSKKYNEISRMK